MNTEKKNKRVVFTMGGKGGVGKTGLMVSLAEWFETNEIPFTLLDLDTENKARGSLKNFFNVCGQSEDSHTRPISSFGQDGDSSVAPRLDYRGSRFESS